MMLWESLWEFHGVCVDFWKAVSNTLDLSFFSRCLAGILGSIVSENFFVPLFAQHCPGGVTFSASQLLTLNESSRIAGH